MQLQKEVISTHKHPSCKKAEALKNLGKKSCEIKSGSQEMATKMLMLINFNNAEPLLTLTSLQPFLGCHF